MKVFLGGTWNGSDWRDKLINNLNINYFNPVVDDWDEDAQREEIFQRETADYVLYVLTPKMKGVFSVAEVVDDAHKRPEKTLFAFLRRDGGVEFDKDQLNSLESVKALLESLNVITFDSLIDIADYLNGKFNES